MRPICASDMDNILNENNVILSENIFGDLFSFIKDFFKQNVENYRMLKQANETIKDIDFYSEVGIDRDTLVQLTKQNVLRSMNTFTVNGKKVNGNNLHLQNNNIDNAINYYIDHKDDNLLKNIYNMVKILKNRNVIESEDFFDFFEYIVYTILAIFGVICIFLLLSSFIMTATNTNVVEINTSKPTLIKFYYSPKQAERESKKIYKGWVYPSPRYEYPKDDELVNKE